MNNFSGWIMASVILVVFIIAIVATALIEALGGKG